MIRSSQQQCRRRWLATVAVVVGVILTMTCAVGMFPRFLNEAGTPTEQPTQTQPTQTQPTQTQPTQLQASANSLAKQTALSRAWPVPVTDERWIPDLQRRALDADLSPVERMEAMKALVESFGRRIEPTILSILANSDDSDVQIAALHVLALLRNPEVVDHLAVYLDNSNPAVRAAAAESLGFVHCPSYVIPIDDSQAQLNTQPPIRIHRLRGEQSQWSPESKIDMPPELRQRLEDLMLRGVTMEERIAAARALVAWPPKEYSLRVAEWGVWISEQGRLQLIDDVLDEIPPFVHQTGNSVDSFAGRLRRITIITKPIIHITADRPLAVDLGVLMRQGRPWFAYPRPDDFALATATRFGRNLSDRGKPRAPNRVLPPLANADLTPLGPLSAGYPWILPNYQPTGSIQGSMGAIDNEIVDMGLRWQSLIVTPDRLAWMKSASVGDDPQHAWWESLRAVPSSWVSSRDETERFVYYDGPTHARPPVSLTSNGQRLTGRTDRVLPDLPNGYHRPTDLPDDDPPSPRTLLVIDVLDGHAQGVEFTMPARSNETFVFELPEAYPFQGAAVSQRLLARLRTAGLSNAEAQGLLDCWHSRFFPSTGRRGFLFLSREDYDRICPLTVRPTPTELARVGIVYFEL